MILWGVRMRLKVALFSIFFVFIKYPCFTIPFGTYECSECIVEIKEKTKKLDDNSVLLIDFIKSIYKNSIIEFNEEGITLNEPFDK